MTGAAPVVGLAVVNVGLPRHLGQHRGRPVSSGIAKQPMAAAELDLSSLNLDGDAQADLRVHGGPDKAVYAYPSEHLADWAVELDQRLGPAPFGENLSTIGWTEDEVRIGDRWAWGSAVLQVSQPRSPCFKLALHRGRGDIGTRMGTSGRTGWYLRVLQPGRVPTAGPITVIERHPMGATVRAMHEASRPDGAPAEVLAALLHVEALADEWKLKLAGRLWG